MSIMGWGKRKNIKMIFKYLLILAGLQAYSFSDQNILVEIRHEMAFIDMTFFAGYSIAYIHTEMQ